MACYRPIPALQYGSEPPRLWPPSGTENLALPCGKCIGCKTGKALQWAQRCEHEAKQYPGSTFVTLTYDDEQLPRSGYLQPRHLQLFLKRLRRRADQNRRDLSSDGSGRIRFFACGEYGERGGRPHYHALLFNSRFADGYKVGKDLSESPTLTKLWGLGGVRYGPATPAAANYIAQYTLKKMGTREYDNDFDPETGELCTPPFLRCSNRPGIGHNWLKQYNNDLAQGYLVHDGRKTNIPRAYMKKLEEHYPHLAEEIKTRKQQHLMNNPSDNNTEERRNDAEKIHTKRKQESEQRTL